MSSGNIFANYTLEFQQGEVIYNQQEDGYSMFVIKDGTVTLSKEANGKSELITEMGKGDFFGELCILENAKRRETATAKTDCVLVVIHRGTFVKMLKGKMEIAIRMLQKLSSKLRQAEDRVDSYFKRLTAFEGQSPTHDSAPNEVTQTKHPAVIGKLVSLSSNRVFMLTADDNLIGRYDPVTGIKPEVDLTAEDDSRSVSRRHASIARRNNKFFLQEEIGVLNGTYVNGAKASGGTQVELKDQDAINFGMLAFKFFLLDEGHA